jgi:hypothetical protein
MIRRSALVASLLGCLAYFQAAHATVFEVDRTVFDLNIAGFITTDGTLGALSASDIDGWNLTVSDVAGSPPPSILTTGNSTLSLIGTGFSATTTQLTFDFSAPGLFQIENLTAAWCLFGSAIGSAECILDDNSVSGPELEALLLGEIADANIQTGVQVIGTVVPEPASLVLLGGAVMALALVRRRAKLLPGNVTPGALKGG